MRVYDDLSIEELVKLWFYEEHIRLINQPTIVFMTDSHIDQAESFQFRLDNGTETTAAFLGAVNSDQTLDLDTNYRIRFEVEETNGGSVNGAVMNLEFDHEGGGFTAVAASGTAVIWATSPNYANSDTTQQIGDGTYITTNNGQRETTDASGTVSFAGNDNAEFEWCFQINSAVASGGDTIVMRLVASKGTVLNRTQTATITVAGNPVIEVPKATLSIETYTPIFTQQHIIAVPQTALSIETKTPIVTQQHFIEVPQAVLSIETYVPTAIVVGPTIVVPQATVGIKTYVPFVTKPLATALSELEWPEYSGLLGPFTVTDRYGVFIDHGGQFLVVTKATTSTPVDGDWNVVAQLQLISGSGTIKAVDADINASDIHIATQLSTGHVAYHRFDPGTDAFISSNIAVANPGDTGAWPNAPTHSGVAIIIQSHNGESGILSSWNNSADTNQGLVWNDNEDGAPDTWGSPFSRAAATKENPRGVTKGGQAGSKNWMESGSTFRQTEAYGLNSGYGIAAGGGVDDAFIISGQGVFDGTDNWQPYIDDSDQISVTQFEQGSASTVGDVNHFNVSDHVVFGNGVSTAPWLVAQCVIVDAAVHLLYVRDSDDALYIHQDVTVAYTDVSIESGTIRGVSGIGNDASDEVEYFFDDSASNIKYNTHLISANVSIDVPQAQLAIETVAPVVTQQHLITVPQLTLSIETYVPVLTLGIGIEVPQATIGFNMKTPVVTQQILITVPQATVGIVMKTPDIVMSYVATVPEAVLAIKTVAPEVTQGFTRAPPKATLGISTVAPIVTQQHLITVPQATLSIETYIPILTEEAGNQIIEVPQAKLGFKTYAPVISGPIAIEVPQAKLGFKTYAPRLFDDTAKVAVARAIAPTSTGTFDIQVPGWPKTPTAAIFWCTHSNTEGDIVRTKTSWSPSLAFGFTDGTNDFCQGGASQHGVLSTDSFRRSRNDECIHMFTADGGAFNLRVTFNSWLTGGVRLNFNFVTGASGCFINVMFFTNANAAVGSTAINAAVTGLGFRPTALIGGNINRVAATTIATNHRQGIGVASDNDGTIDEGCIAINDDDNESGGGDTSNIIRNDAITAAVSQGSELYNAGVASFDSDGFTLDSASSDNFIYLALEGCEFKVQTIDSATSVGDKSYTGVGFKPIAAIIIQGEQTAINTFEGDGADVGMYGMSLITERDEFGAGFISKDGADPTVIGGWGRNTAITVHRPTDSVLVSLANLKSFDADGATFTYSVAPGTAHKYVVLWIGDTKVIEVPKATLGIKTYAPIVTVLGTVVVPQATLGIATVAPIVTQQHLITVPQATLGFSTFAPVVGVSSTVEVPQATLGIAPVAPVVTQQHNITVPQAILGFITFAPTLLVSGTIVVPQATLGIAPVAPVVTQQHLITVPQAVLGIATKIPTAIVGSPVTELITVPQATLGFAVKTPVVTQQHLITVPQTTLGIATVAPLVAQTFAVIVPQATLGFSTKTPTLSRNILISPPKAAMGVRFAAPIVTEQTRTVSPPKTTLGFKTFAPILTQAILIEVPQGQLGFSTRAPNVDTTLPGSILVPAARMGFRMHTPRVSLGGEKIRLHRVLANTVGATQDIIVPGWTGIPSAAIIWCTHGKVDGLTGKVGIVYSPCITMGFTDGVNSVCQGTAGNTEVNKSDTGRWNESDDFILIRVANAGTIRSEARFGAFIPGGMQIIWDNNPSSGNPHWIHVLYFVDVTAKCGSTVFGATAGVGFRPTAVFGACSQFSPNNSHTSDGSVSWGIAHDAPGGIDQALISHYEEDNLSVPESSGIIRDNAFVSGLSQNSENYSVSMQSFDPDGFTTDGSPGDILHYLAISGCNFKVGVIDSAIVTGPKSYTGAGFPVRGAAFITGDHTAVNTFSNNGVGSMIGFGVATGIREYNAGYTTEDGAADATVNTWSHPDTVIVYDHQSNLVSQANLQSLDADGVTLNYTIAPSTAHKYVALYIGDRNIQIPPPEAVLGIRTHVPIVTVFTPRVLVVPKATLGFKTYAPILTIEERFKTVTVPQFRLAINTFAPVVTVRSQNQSGWTDESKIPGQLWATESKTVGEWTEEVKLSSDTWTEETKL